MNLDDIDNIYAKDVESIDDINQLINEIRRLRRERTIIMNTITKLEYLWILLRNSNI
jgi:glutamate synthase domain-containing protein 2